MPSFSYRPTRTPALYVLAGKPAKTKTVRAPADSLDCVGNSSNKRSLCVYGLAGRERPGLNKVRGGASTAAPVPSSSAEPVVKGPVAAVRGPASADIGQWDGNLDASIGCLTGYLARVIDDPEAALAQLKE